MTDATVPSIDLISPAKVNLALSVAPAAPPKGYHPIASWMVAVDFGDDLHVSLLRDPKVSSVFERSFAADAPFPQPIDWPIEKDLAFRAHALLEQHVGRALPVRVTLRKRIPAGAGLGGGSGNAAGVMTAVNQLFDLKIPLATLMKLAEKLGSDVVFAVSALAGKPSALVTGFGESIQVLDLKNPIDIVLIFPPFGCPTADVYRAFDHAPAPADGGANEPRVRALTTQSPFPADAPFNDLAEPACIVRPALRDLMQKIGNALLLPVHVTGSGSTLFVIATDAETAKKLSRKITTLTSLPAVATRTL